MKVLSTRALLAAVTVIVAAAAVTTGIQVPRRLEQRLGCGQPS